MQRTSSARTTASCAGGKGAQGGSRGVGGGCAAWPPACMAFCGLYKTAAASTVHSYHTIRWPRDEAARRARTRYILLSPWPPHVTRLPTPATHPRLPFATIHPCMHRASHGWPPPLRAPRSCHPDRSGDDESTEFCALLNEIYDVRGHGQLASCFSMGDGGCTCALGWKGVAPGQRRGWRS